MCGLVGMYSEQFLTTEERKLLQCLFIASYTRGKDSTGIVTLTKKGDVLYDKQITPSPVYAFGTEYAELTNPINNMNGPVCVLGHTRYGTVGANILSNAHPFETQNFVGMHNGTIFDPFPGSKEFGTDSEGLLNFMDREGIIPALQYIHKECWEPAYAIQLMSKGNDEVYIVKNEARDLWFTTVSEGQTLVWASALNTLRWALFVSGFTAKKPSFIAGNKDFYKHDKVYTEDSSPYWSPKTGVIMTLDLTKPAGTCASVEKFDVPEYKWSKSAVPFTGHTATSVSTTTKTNGGNSKWIQSPRHPKVSLSTGMNNPHLQQAILEAMQGNGRKNSKNKKTGITTSLQGTVRGEQDQTTNSRFSSANSNKKKSSSGVFQNYRGYGNRIMRKKEILTHLAKGCATCGIEVSETDYEAIRNLKWITPTEFACEGCANLYNDVDLATFAMQ